MPTWCPRVARGARPDAPRKISPKEPPPSFLRSHAGVAAEADSAQHGVRRRMLFVRPCPHHSMVLCGNVRALPPCSPRGRLVAAVCRAAVPSQRDLRRRTSRYDIFRR
eukprot:351645-Chlamydomonas_euryale.AAC.9